MEIVSKKEIQKYAELNTSPKMTIEKKYVYAFIDALLNSTSLQELYSILADETQDGDAYLIYNSYWATAKNVNKEPYRSIVAYAMLKKDFRLFELISYSLFTGSVTEYHGSDLYLSTSKYTDESPLKYTDEGLYTDMSEGLVQIGFKNLFCNDPLADGTGSEYQTLEELEDAITSFDNIITMVKPARIEVLLFYEPYCFIGGDALISRTVGIDQSEEALKTFSTPFGPNGEGPNESVEILLNMTDAELDQCYRQVFMIDVSEGTYRNIESSRTTIKGDGFIIFRYEFRCRASTVKEKQDDGTTVTKTIVWSDIRILSNTSSKTYVLEKKYDAEADHSEKYVPILLRLNDNDPDGPILAFYEGGTDDIGAMFFERETQ